MKKLATLLTLALAVNIANAENIDGTLAVDSKNSLTNVHKSAKNTLSAGMNGASCPTNVASDTLSAGLDDSASDNLKNTSEPLSVPVGTQSFLEGPFVGFELNAVTASDTVDESASGMSFGIRFGAQNIDWRTMAVVESFSNGGNDNSYARGILQVDYFFLGPSQMKIDTYGIRPYAGLNAGLISLDTNDENIKSLTYGAQLGATMNLTNNIDLDLSYRYNLSSSDKIDHTSGISAGIHYRY